VRLDFQEIVLTIPEFPCRKEAKLTGLSAIDHFPKIRSICHTLCLDYIACFTVNELSKPAPETMLNNQ
jgi:hypothetical protein